MHGQDSLSVSFCLSLSVSLSLSLPFFSLSLSHANTHTHSLSQTNIRALFICPRTTFTTGGASLTTEKAAEQSLKGASERRKIIFRKSHSAP